jgi:hypothetical protein
MATYPVQHTTTPDTQATASPVWKVERHADGRTFTDWYAADVTWHDNPGAAQLLNVPLSERDGLYPYSTRAKAEKAWLKKHSPFPQLPHPCTAFTTAPRGCTTYRGKFWRPGMAVKVTPTYVEVLLAGQYTTRRVPFALVLPRDASATEPAEMEVSA